MINDTAKRNCKLNKLFTSNLEIKQVLEEVLKEDTDFAFFFIFPLNGDCNRKNDFFEKNKSFIKSEILNITLNKKLPFDKFYNLMLIYFEDDFKSYNSSYKAMFDTNINSKNIELFDILINMDIQKDELEENLPRLTKLLL